MQYISLGSSGLRVSRLCLGTMTYGTPAWRPWVLSEEASRPFFRQAIEAGINFFDTADMYSNGVSEEVVGRGLLAGTRRPGLQGETSRAKTDDFARRLYEDSDFEVVDRVVEVAGKRGIPPAQVALAWLLSRPGVTAPIIGASKPGHLNDAIAALSVTLTDEEVRRLEEPYRPHEVKGH
ncbi:MAG: aldo/keto reductase [Acidobacteriota bacterium]|nr:aldo/keto reductase [Acidobacteriota bacterium]